MSKSLKNIYVVLHNVHAVSKILDTAQVVYGLGVPNFVVSKPEGSAAMSGVPEANKMALKLGYNFMVLADLPDVLEILDIDHPILFVSPKLTKNRVSLQELTRRINSGGRIALIFSGSTSSFSRKEMDLGDCTSLSSDFDIGPAGTAAVILYSILNELE